MYIVVSKRIIFEGEGGQGVLPQNFLKQYSYKMVQIHDAIMMGTSTKILYDKTRG